jgi:hypothetical protein
MSSSFVWKLGHVPGNLGTRGPAGGPGVGGGQNSLSNEVRKRRTGKSGRPGASEELHTSAQVVQTQGSVWLLPPWLPLLQEPCTFAPKQSHLSDPAMTFT